MRSAAGAREATSMGQGDIPPGIRGVDGRIEAAGRGQRDAGDGSWRQMETARWEGARGNGRPPQAGMVWGPAGGRGEGMLGPRTGIQG